MELLKQRLSTSQIYRTISPYCKVIDCNLTESFRFGPEIAAVANVILGCKENSPQTSGQKKKSWNPYRITGIGAPGYVTTVDLVHEIYPSIKQGSVKSPVTVIAFTNMELLKFALTLLCPKPNLATELSKGQNNSNMNRDNELKRPSHQYKISLLGTGESSGRQKWMKNKKNLINFYNIFMKQSTEIKCKPWLDENEPITWQRVCSDVETFDLGEYRTVIDLINEFKDNTLKEFSKFEKGVIDANHRTEEADVILTTIHAAKGTYLP